MITGTTANILGGAGAGAAMGGIGGMMTGEEGAVGKGVVGGAIVGGIAGAGASSLMSSGGILNRAAMSVGGIADDMLGNTSNAAYFKALRSNVDISATMDASKSKQAYSAAQKEYDEAFSNFAKAQSQAFDDFMDSKAYTVNDKNKKIKTEEFKKLRKRAGKQHNVSASEVTDDQLRETYLRERFDKAEDMSLGHNDQGQEIFEERGKSLLERISKTKNAFDTEFADSRTTMQANQKIIDAGPSGSGSISDFFQGLGDSTARAQNNVAEYQRLGKKVADGSIEDADYARMMNLESEMGPGLTRSINNRRAGYDMHGDTNFQDYMGRMKGNVSDRNRAITFAGAGLTGVMVGSQMGNRRNHKRGMNAKRGARF